MAIQHVSQLRCVVCGTARVKRALAADLIKKDESVCTVITGNGLKDIKAAIESAGTPMNTSR